MSREEKIATIYKEIADKELTFGCKITTNEYNGDEFRISASDSLAIKKGESYSTTGCGCCSEGLTIKEIIGHPVMINRIEYVLSDRDYKKVRGSIDKNELILPVEERNDVAINTLYEIIKNV